jgi:hypothetical protein
MARVNGLGMGQSNDWFTPDYVFDALGCRFDLDVAAPESGPLHVPCHRWISANSLDFEWFGFVWMNPPFGGRNGIWPWLDKFLAHGNGIALTPDRTSAPWFHAAWDRADAILSRARLRSLGRMGLSKDHPPSERRFGLLARAGWTRFAPLPEKASASSVASTPRRIPN